MPIRLQQLLNLSMLRRSFTMMFLMKLPSGGGRETLHSKWGNKVAVLVGDYLHARVLSMLVGRRADDLAMALLSDATHAMCEGEVIHAYKNGDFNISQDDYLKIIEMKTGKLITASCAIGAILGAQDPQSVQAATDYGEAIGAAFQIIDDLLDLVADGETLGKEPFNDLRDGKLTFPMIYAREVCTTEERTELERLFSLQMDEAGSIEWIESLLERYQIQTHCRGVAQEYADHAKSALNVLPKNGCKGCPCTTCRLRCI